MSAQGYYLPREHGGWALLAAPPLTGIAAAGGGGSTELWLFWAALLGAFLLRTPLEAFIRRPSDRRALFFLLAYGAAGGGAALLLITRYGRWGLALLAIPGVAAMLLHIRLSIRRRAQSSRQEILAVAVLCLGAPAALYVKTGHFGAQAGWLWLLNTLYFIGPLFHVKMAIAQYALIVNRNAERRFRDLRRSAWTYHAAATAAAGALVFASVVPPLAGAPFLLAAGKTVYRGLSVPVSDIRLIGWQEVGYTLLFVCLVAAGYLAG
ncbi:MAG: YwiC-like family protein [Elusimicrobiota bacterium]